jgi:hypothetical protein
LTSVTGFSFRSFTFSSCIVLWHLSYEDLK